jgi:hypothetical protein
MILSIHIHISCMQWTNHLYADLSFKFCINFIANCFLLASIKYVPMCVRRKNDLFPGVNSMKPLEKAYYIIMYM